MGLQDLFCACVQPIRQSKLTFGKLAYYTWGKEHI